MLPSFNRNGSFCRNSRFGLFPKRGIGSNYELDVFFRKNRSNFRVIKKKAIKSLIRNFKFFVFILFCCNRWSKHIDRLCFLKHNYVNKKYKVKNVFVKIIHATHSIKIVIFLPNFYRKYAFLMKKYIEDRFQ